MKLSRHLIVLVLPALLACGGKPKPVNAPSSLVQAISDGGTERVARVFPRTDLRFGVGGAKFFLWKLKTTQECPARLQLPLPGSQNPGGPRRAELGACPNDIAFVLDTSKQLNRSDDQKFLIQGERVTIRENTLATGIRNTAGVVLGADELVKLIDVELPRVPEHERNRDRVAAQQETAKGQRASKKAELDAELAKPETEQNQELIGRLRSEIASLETKIANLQKQIDRFNALIADARGASQQVAQAGLVDDLARYRELDVLARDIDTTCTRLTQEIDRTVDLYAFSDRLTVDIRFPVDGIDQE
ncbi:MAG TPA: hypothetical protein VM598_10340, partial [Bdellovibrionota bacterium]|nr:hypothetical protein [Bdellovibrionota bacterium]